MYQGGDEPLQGLCEEFDSLRLHMSNYRSTRTYERFSEYLSEIQRLDLNNTEDQKKAIEAAKNLVFAYNPFKYHKTKLEAAAIIEKLKNEL